MTGMEPALDLSGFLDRVEDGLNNILQDPQGSDGQPDAGTLFRAARHLCIGAGGKRVRPLMVRLFADACGAPLGHMVDVAVAAGLDPASRLRRRAAGGSGACRRWRATVG